MIRVKEHDGLVERSKLRKGDFFRISVCHREVQLVIGHSECGKYTHYVAAHGNDPQPSKGPSDYRVVPCDRDGETTHVECGRWVGIKEIAIGRLTGLWEHEDGYIGVVHSCTDGRTFFPADGPARVAGKVRRVNPPEGEWDVAE